MSAEDDGVKSTITVCVQFDFKGESYSPSALIDLDRLMAQYGNLPDFHQWLAKVGDIDPYSYQYEVLESCALEFSDPTGFAEVFFNDGTFDAEGFQEQWREQQRLQRVQEVARRCLGIEDLAQQPALKEALLAAYMLGREEG